MEKQGQILFKFLLTDKKGHWNGNKSGIVVNFQSFTYKNIKFPIKGDYKFKLIQAMRDTVLKEVMSLGLKITKPKKGDNSLKNNFEKITKVQTAPYRD
jgi:gliding motility-associated lipoprotein GldH